MGIVYRAYHARTQREVALKMLHHRPLQPIHCASQHFKQEAAAAAKLTASHVLPVFYVIDHGPVPIIVMPLVNGTSLDRILTRRGTNPGPTTLHVWHDLPVTQLLRNLLGVVDQIIQAVVAIHKAGVLHRDIKPSNILVDRDGSAWLSDFGLARLADSHA